MPPLVRELMRPALFTCPPAATLGEAAALLARHRVHALVVAEAPDQPLGVLSDIDLLAGEWLATDAESLRSMRAVTARDLMTAPPATIAAEAEASEAAAQMRAGRLHRLIVMDQGRAVGVLSVSDLVAYLGRGPLGRQTVADVMSRGIVVCRPDTPLAAAARAMTERRSRSLVVVDAHGQAVGVVTGYDLLPFAAAGVPLKSVADVMQPPIVIEPAASLRTAVDRMLQHRIHRLVVVDPDQPTAAPLGLISTSDIVTLMAAPGSAWQFPAGPSLDQPVDAIVARVPRWQGAQLTTSFLAGGITNKNYRVDVGGESFVLRVSGANTELLGIRRDQEYAAAVAAASIDIGPEVIDCLQPEGYLVTRFVAGRPMPPAELGQPEGLLQVAGLLRRVHALPPIAATFSPFRIVEAYEATARRFAVTAFPANYAWLRERMNAVEAAFLKEPYPPRLCHNDLLNENFILEAPRPGNAGGLRILDWEYAGMGDVFFDLANFAVNHGLSDDQDRLLLDAYFAPGGPRPADRARHKLMKIMSDFREAMWGVVQIGISQLDFDFRAYADKHFARMTEAFHDPRCAQWLGQL